DNIHYFSTSQFSLSTIISFLIKHKFTAILDCAAAFRDFPWNEDGIPTFVIEWYNQEKKENKTKSKLKGIIFMCKDDRPYVYAEKEKKKKNKINHLDLIGSIPGEYFYYYNQAHTIGTDLDQPVELKGLVMIASYLSKSAVAQA